MKRLAVLVGILVLVVAANFFIQNNRHLDEVNTETVLLDALLEQADALVSVKVENATGTVFSAMLQNGQWMATHLNENNRFPVEQSQLKQFVGDLANARVIEEKSAKPKNFSRLGVSDISVQNSNAHLVTLMTSNQEWTLLLGEESDQRQARFVRFPTGNQTYLVDNTLALPQDSIDWLVNPALSFSVDEIKEIRASGEVTWSLINDSQDSGWQLSGLRADEELAYDGIIETTARAFANIRYESVVPRQSPQFKWVGNSANTAFKIATENNEWTFNILENEELSQVWLTVDNVQDAWQTKWAYQIPLFERDRLLVNRSSFLKQADEGGSANP